MPKMTGGQALAKQLHREGVRVIFGLPGVQLYHALDALAQETDIKFITTRHEQATAYMADGYSRARRRHRHGACRAGTGLAERIRGNRYCLRRIVADHGRCGAG